MSRASMPMAVDREDFIALQLVYAGQAILKRVFGVGNNLEVQLLGQIGPSGTFERFKVVADLGHDVPLDGVFLEKSTPAL